MTIADVLAETDEAVRAGRSAGPAPVPTGFTPLDGYLGGGLRPGELTLLGGPQGLGKTTFAMQLARNVASSGRDVVVFSFEHDETTLLARLVSLEAGLRAVGDPVHHRFVRAALDQQGAADGFGARLGPDGGGAAAVEAVRRYGSRVHLRQATGRATTVEDVRTALSAFSGQERPVVVVDYLQKVAVEAAPETEDQRVALVVESLKDMAMELSVPVFAVVAVDKSGLASRGRLRVHHLRGSSALAYEPDVVLMLNDKYDIVARHHLMYDVGNAERFREWAVVSIEKNRGGLDHVDLQFRKRFEVSMFEPEGELVAEQLVDERVHVE